MNNFLEFKKREIIFLDSEKKLPPFRGYQITNSKNYEELTKILKIQDKKYNSYVTIACYSDQPRISLNPKKHWPEFREWVTIRDETIKNMDFMLDFDAEPSIKGLTKAWRDVQTALKLLPELIGEQTKYLTIWFSGNKGFHILGKCRNITTAEENINRQLEIALQLSLLCPTLDTSIYDTARLRKLLGSYVYSNIFGKTRVIPIPNQEEFEQLLIALDTKDKQWFENKQLINLGTINIMELNKK